MTADERLELIADIVAEWLAAARLHEEAASQSDSKEQAMHDEATRVYRTCVRRLIEALRQGTTWRERRRNSADPIS